MRPIEHDGVRYLVGVHPTWGRALLDPNEQPEPPRARLALLDVRRAVLVERDELDGLDEPDEHPRELGLWAREYLMLLETGRTSCCHACGATLRQAIAPRCRACGWMQCSCGSCGCDSNFVRRHKYVVGR